MKKTLILAALVAAFALVGWIEKGMADECDPAMKGLPKIVSFENPAGECWKKVKPGKHGGSLGGSFYEDTAPVGHSGSDFIVHDIEVDIPKMSTGIIFKQDGSTVLTLTTGNITQEF